MAASLTPATPLPDDENEIWWPDGSSRTVNIAGLAPQAGHSGNLTRSAMVAATVAAVATSTLLGPGLTSAAPQQASTPPPNPVPPTTGSFQTVNTPAATPATGMGGGGQGIDYVVESGDTLYKIAGKYGVATTAVIAANDLANPNFILPGQHINVPTGSGGGEDLTITVEAGNTVNKLAAHYGVSAASIIASNNLANPNLIIAGQKLIIPGATSSGDAAAADTQDDSAPQAELQSASDAQPVAVQASNPAPAEPPAPDPAPAPQAPASQGFVWPAKGTITQEFGPTSFWMEPAYQGYAHFHQGLDIAAGMYTPISAAEAGTVTFAGWNNYGYGFCVQIDNGNGVVTLYGHMAQQPSVSVGESVSAGQLIGKMGSTGASTGSHLHFAVQKNGVWVNPLNYLP